MEPGNGDSPKLPDMVMCGDHPTVMKTDPSVLEDEKEKREKMSNPRIMASVSHTEEEPTERALSVECRGAEARRRARSIDTVRAEGRSDDSVIPGNRALVQAALGSFRWPPYLVAVWVLVLLLTHALHCVVALLERALPSIRRCCEYFRCKTEEAWRGEGGGGGARAGPMALAACTAALYGGYWALCALHAATLWAMEPLLQDDDKRDVETRVTDYLTDSRSSANKRST